MWKPTQLEYWNGPVDTYILGENIAWNPDNLAAHVESVCTHSQPHFVSFSKEYWSTGRQAIFVASESHRASRGTRAIMIGQHLFAKTVFVNDGAP